MTAPLATLDSTRMLDADQLNELLINWRIDSMQLGQGEIEVISDRIEFPDLTVERSRQNLAKSDLYEVPPDTTVFSIFRPGVAPAHWCGFDIPDNVLVVNQAGREHFAVLPAGYEHISIWVSTDLLARRALLPHAMVDNLAISRRSVIPLAESEATSFRQWLFGQFASRGKLKTLTAFPEEATLFRERLLSGLGYLLHRGFAFQGTRPCPGRSVRRFAFVRRASEIVEERIEETFTTDELAVELGVNLRTLQRGFAEVFGVTPYQYIHRCKLRAVRRELRRTPHKTSVSRVAIKYGFTELGRFSVRYRQMFGQLPSETLKEGTRMFPVGIQRPR